MEFFLGSILIDIGVGYPSGGDFTTVRDVLVDTGAAHTMLPESLLARLHIEPRMVDRWTFADGGIREMGYGMARILIDDMDWHCLVIFGPEEQYLVGATTLEIFGLMVDPAGQELIPRTYRARAI